MEQIFDFGRVGTILLILYLVLMIIIGFAAKKKEKEKSLSEFFLCGRKMGLIILFFTFYATQYSGNTFSAFPGKIYQAGFVYLIVGPCILLAPILAYTIFAKKLYRLSRENRFITIGDYVEYRFKSRLLTILTMLALIFGLASFIITNLKAAGFIVETISGSRISSAEGIIIIAVVMVIYETLGGLTSVAWTDLIQGILILVGCIVIFIFLFSLFDSFSDFYNQLSVVRPNFWSLPKRQTILSLISVIGLSFFGLSIYPHAIQRIYAAKDEVTLKRSIGFMTLMPFFTTVPMLLFAVVGIIYFPGLGETEKEKITFYMLQKMYMEYPLLNIPIIFFLIAVAAAVMSTIDSILLAISSLFTANIYKYIRPDLTEKELLFFGKSSSWVIMGVTTILALLLPQTLWRLLIIKLDIISQVAPALFVGIFLKNINSKAILYGFISGVFFVIVLFYSQKLNLPFSSKPFGINAGIWGLTVNFAIIFVTHRFFPSMQKLKQICL